MLRPFCVDFRQRAAIFSLAIVSTVVTSPIVRAETLVQSVPVGVQLATQATIEPYAAWSRLIASAARSIDIALATLDDAPATPVANIVTALAEAATARGVRLRIVVDETAVVEESSRSSLARLATITGAEIRVARFHGTMNVNLMIADRSDAVVGSAALDARSRAGSHDIGIRLGGQAASRLLEVFDRDWTAARAFPTDHDESGPARTAIAAAAAAARVQSPESGILRFEAATSLSPLPLVATSPDTTGFHSQIDILVGLIGSATRSLDIELASYSTRGPDGERWSTLQSALEAAAGRGVRIRLTLAGARLTNPEAIAAAQALARQPNTQVRYTALSDPNDDCIGRSAVRQGRIMIVDEAVTWIGTGDWTYGDIYASRNVAVVSTTPALAATARRVYDSLWSSRAVRGLVRGGPVPVRPRAACRQAQDAPQPHRS